MRHDFPKVKWEGFKINGRTFDSVEVAALSSSFGHGQVLEACKDLDLMPTPEDIPKIRELCQAWEDALV